MLTEREIFSYLLNLGIKVRPNAMDTIKSQFNAVSNNPDELEKLISKWTEFKILDIKNIQQISEKYEKQQIDEDCEINVVDLFDKNAKLVFSPQVNKFVLSAQKSSYLNVDSSQSFGLNIDKAKGSMFIDRFVIAQARIRQHSGFKSNGKDTSMISTIDSLIGSRGEKIVLGILTKNDGKNWILEDLNSSIKLEFCSPERNSGFFCEGCILLVQGESHDGIFKVSCIAHPPLSCLPSEAYAGTEQNWTIPWPDHSYIVYISEAHLDDARVLAHLDKLFLGYSSHSNIMFVFIGNFSSQKEPDVYNYNSMFDNLVQIIQKYEKLVETCMWVFIPGPNDPGVLGFMPKRAISPRLALALENLKKSKMSSNPTKISFCGKKIIVVRTEQLRKMQRNTAIEVNYEENKEPEAHLAHTVLKQGHLCPSLHTPVIPDYDYALRIDQSLDFLCIAESTKSFIYKIEGVTVFNPGHFSRYSNFIVQTGRNLVPEEFSID